MKKQLCLLVVCLLAGTLAAVAQAQVAAPTVTDAFNSPIKIDGRMFVGLFDSGNNGNYPNRTVDIPDAKLRFTYTPSKDITVVTRLDLAKLNKASAGSLDYYYLDLNNWGGLFPGHVMRLGKMKEDIGEETWTDNPIESILITNSAAHVSGYDAGVDFRGPLPVGRPAMYSLSLLDNTGGTGSSNNPAATTNGNGGLGTATQALGVGGKIGVAPMDNLWVSASMYDSGDSVLPNGTVTTPLAVAGLASAGTGMTRRLWEVDARYNYGKFGNTPAIPSSANPAPFQVAVSYGQVNDTFTGAAARSGSFGFIEGLYNVTSKVYVASRYSQVQLSGSETAKMVDSPIAVNKYTRLGLGAGYHLSPLSDLKVEYTINGTDGGATSPHLNQAAIGIATKF